MVPDQTLPEYVLGEAAEHGGRCALIDAASGEALTYAELVDKVGRAGHGLRAAGVRPGDVVALCSTNSIDFVVAWYAALTIGATVTTVSPHSKASEFTDHFLATDTRWVITTAHLFESVLRNAALSTAVAGTFVVDGDPAGATAFEQIIAAGKSCLPTGLASPSDTAFLPRSSGTSGLPKSVVLTHRNLVASLSQMRDAHGVTSSDTVLASLPLVHTFGLQVTLNLSLRAGACVVLMPRFEIEGFLDTIQRHHVTRAEIVPPIVQALANTDLLDDYDLSSLHVMTVGAAPMSSDLVTTCARRTGCHVKQVYGMTELAGSSHIAPDDGPDKPWSIGPTVQGVECRVIDPTTGAEVAAGQPGELLVRAPSVMRRYLNDEEATAAAIDADGWLHTGDVVTVDDEGWYEVVDRLKEMIKYKGFQVAPAELEQLLLSHPSVADAAVVGLPDDEAGEVPQAFVVRRTALTDDELMAWVAGRVTPYKRIRRVEFVESIPKSPSGKILRRLLARPQQIPARELDGAVALVSGGGRGLGRFLAERLVDAGARVALIGRSEASLEEAAASIRARGGIVATAVADVTDIERTRAAVAAVTEQLGPIDVLVNNAGINGPMGPLWETDPAEWWRAVEINFGGAYMLTSAVLPGMVSAGRGRVISITSQAAVHRWPLVSSYAAAKAAVVKLTETLAAELKPHGVSVFSFDPGLLPIGLSEAALASTAGPETAEGQVFGWIKARLAAGRGADPEIAAGWVVNLAAGRGDALSGRHMNVGDDLDDLLARIDDIKRNKLHLLALRKF